MLVEVVEVVQRINMKDGNVQNCCVLLFPGGELSEAPVSNEVVVAVLRELQAGETGIQTAPPARNTEYLPAAPVRHQPVANRAAQEWNAAEGFSEEDGDAVAG